MERPAIILLISLCASHTVVGQDPVFSQFYTSSLYLNPALAGLEEDVTVGMNYRSQWAGVDLPFKTFQVSAIHPIIQQGVRSKQLGGVGATLFSDQAGRNRELETQGFSLASSYNFHLNRHGNHMIATALQFGVIQRQLNMDALQWSSQYSTVIGYDPSLPGEQLVAERATSAVINGGAMWRLVIDNRLMPVKMFYQGFAASTLNRPKGFFLNKNDMASISYKLHGGYLHRFGNGFEVSPNYLIQYQRKTQINIGGYAAYALQGAVRGSVDDLKVSLGVWRRIGDSYIVTTGCSTSKWTAGFSYDANTTSFERNFQGANAFEISFVYRIKILKNKRTFSTPLI